MSHVKLKEAQGSFVLLSRGASRKQLKLKTRCLIVGACGRESNLLSVNTHEWGKNKPDDDLLWKTRRAKPAQS